MKMISLDAILRILDEDGIVFRKTIEELPTNELYMCKDCKYGSKTGECLLPGGPEVACLSGKMKDW